MTASAEYWRVEIQRLTARQQAGPAPRAYPGATGPIAPAAPVGDTDEPTRTKLGKLAKAYGKVASLIGSDGHQIAEFTVGAPTAATCGPTPTNPVSQFIPLPSSLTTYDDPPISRSCARSGHGRFVGTHGRSLTASTSAATSCA